MRVPLPLRRFAADRFTVLLLAFALALFAVTPGGTAPTPCPDGPAAVKAETASPRPAAVMADDERPSNGIDLTLRVWNLRVEFPWMRALPVSPGHHIVISLFARGPAE